MKYIFFKKPEFGWINYRYISCATSKARMSIKIWFWNIWCFIFRLDWIEAVYWAFVARPFCQTVDFVRHGIFTKTMRTWCVCWFSAYNLLSIFLTDVWVFLAEFFTDFWVIFRSQKAPENPQFVIQNMVFVLYWVEDKQCHT